MLRMTFAPLFSLQDRLKMKERERAGSRGQPLRGAVRGGGVGKAGRTRARSQWMQGSVHIQTERGSVVILRPPGKDQLRESIQWLQSDEGQGWLEVRRCTPVSLLWMA